MVDKNQTDDNPNPPHVKADQNMIKQLQGTKNDHVVGSAELDENGEPLFRTELPWLKDPSIKISYWEIIKNNLGREFSKFSLPVYYNEPGSML